MTTYAKTEAYFDDFLLEGNFYESAATSITVTPATNPLSIYFGELTDYDISEGGITVSKSIDDTIWSCEGDIIGSITAPLWKNFTCTFKDTSNTDQLIFYGPVVGCVQTLEVNANTARFRGFSYEYYLAKQLVEYRHIAAWNYIGDGSDYDYFSATYWEHPMVSRTTPVEEIMIRILAGDPHGVGWRTETGIEPYLIDACTTYGGTTTPYRLWKLDDDQTTKADLIREICDFCNMIFEVYPVKDGTGVYHPRAYFINWDDIDTKLPLPAQVTITKGTTDGQLLGAFEVEENADDQVNNIVVHGYWTPPGGGTYIAGSWESPSYSSHDEIQREYFWKDPYIEDNTMCSDIAHRLSRTLGTSTKVYRFKLWKRFDLRLYQKIRFVGWDTGIVPSDVLRIISISYNKKLDGDVVECEAITNVDFLNAPFKKAALSNEVSEMEAMVQKYLGKNILPILCGDVPGEPNDDGTVTVTLERDGRQITVKDIWS
jgi:hypothetical protein